MLSLLAAVSFLISCGDDEDPKGEAKSDAKEILDFTFAGLTPSVKASINGTAISATVPFGTDVTALKPSVTVSPKSTVNPASGEAQDFSSAITYTVTAEDGTTQAYTVTVTDEPGSAEKMITSFTFAGLDPAVVATIDADKITASVPFGTDLTTLVPTIEVSDFATVNPASGVAADFSSAISFTVTAQDATTAVYEVTITELPKPGLNVTALWELTVAKGAVPAWFTANNDADIAFGNGSVYAMNARNKIRILDPATGLEKEADKFISQKATGLSGIYANFSGVKVDSKGNILTCTGTLANGNFYVYKWASETGKQDTMLIAPTMPARVDNFAVVGDMDGSGYIYAVGSSTNKVFKWKVENGAVANVTPETIVVTDIATFGPSAAIFPLSADANADFYVNGNTAAMQPTLVGADGTVKATLPEGIVTGFSADMVYFTLGSNKVLVTINGTNTTVQDLVFIDVTDGLANVEEGDVTRKTFADGTAASGNGNATGGVGFQVNDNSVTVYGMLTNNGIAAYEVKLAE